METLVTVLIIEIQQDERATPSGTGAPAPPLPASGSLSPTTCPPSLLLLGVHHWHPLEDTKGSVAHSHPALLPSPDLLDGRHHLLDVILGPAPGLGPNGPAGHAGGTGAEAEPAAGPPPVRRAQARRQTRAPLSRPAVPPGVGRALPRSPTPPRVPAPFPAAAPRPGRSPERRGGAGGQSPGLEVGRPRPDRARPLGAPRRAAPPTRSQEGGLGTAWRQDSRGWAEEVRSDHVGTGRGRRAREGHCPSPRPQRGGGPECCEHRVRPAAPGWHSRAVQLFLQPFVQ